MGKKVNIFVYLLFFIFIGFKVYLGFVMQAKNMDVYQPLILISNKYLCILVPAPLHKFSA